MGQRCRARRRGWQGRALLPAAARQELASSRRQLRRPRQQGIESLEQFVAAEVEQRIARVGETGEEVHRLEQRLVRAEEIASGPAALLGEDEARGEQAREGGTVAFQHGAHAPLGDLAAPKLADRREIDHFGARPASPGLCGCAHYTYTLTAVRERGQRGFTGVTCSGAAAAMQVPSGLCSAPPNVPPWECA